MKKLCVFDLDGTLVNSLPDIGAALDRALAELGLPSFTPEEYRQKVGNGARMLCRRCLPAGREGLLEPLLARYNALYLAHCTERTVPYPGVPALLTALRAKNIRTAVISNKPHEQTLEVAARVLATAPPDVVLGQRPGVPLKPAPDALTALLRAEGLSPADALYVGDSPEDVRFGKGAGVETCAVLWGYRDRAALAAEGPDHLAQDPADILAVL